MRPSMARDNFEKHDRLIRLMRELALFQAQPRGLTSAQIAQKMEISQRQAQRDLVALESHPQRVRRRAYRRQIDQGHRRET